MLSRHGSRYPTSGANVMTLGDKLAKAKGHFKASGALAFLTDWEYHMGHEILVPKGELLAVFIIVTLTRPLLVARTFRR